MLRGEDTLLLVVGGGLMVIVGTDAVGLSAVWTVSI